MDYSHHLDVSKLMHSDSSLTQTTILVTLLNKFPFFSKYLNAGPSLLILGLSQYMVLEVQIDTPKTVSYVRLSKMIWSSSVHLSTSRSNYFDSLYGSTITDPNTVRYENDNENENKA